LIEYVAYVFAAGFAGVILILILDLLARNVVAKRSTIGGIVSSAIFAVFGYLTLSLWNAAQANGEKSLSLGSEILSTTLHISFAGLYVFGIAAVLGAAASIYSIKYMERHRNSALFHALMVLLGVSIFGVVMAGDLLSLFVFWESMSVCAYGLVAFRKASWEALEASIKYLLLAGAGSLVALYGIAVLYAATGTLNFRALALLAIEPSPSILFGLALIISGFGVEAAIVPLHTWLPDAHPAAPSPMSAMLSGIIIEVGSFTIIRVIAVAFLSQGLVVILQPIIVLLAALTMLVGNLSAYGQDDLKRLLAFSSVAQVGYILLGVSTFTAAGIAASFFHIWNHGLLKGLFFLLSGILSFSLGTRSLQQIAGVGRKWPSIGLLVSINALAMTGVPPFGMFWSEFLVILAALETRSALLLAGGSLMLVNVAFSISYYFRIMTRVAFDKPTEFVLQAKLPFSSKLMLMPCAALIALSLLTGFLPDMFYSPALQAVKAMIGP
jgi:proton-translocating NADH-quinone oxidoreductase chain N